MCTPSIFCSPSEMSKVNIVYPRNSLRISRHRIDEIFSQFEADEEISNYTLSFKNRRSQLIPKNLERQSLLGRQRAISSRGQIKAPEQEKEKEKDKEKAEVDEESETTDLTIGFFHPKRRFYAYLLLSVICIISVAGYFTYDSPGVVQEDMERDLKITASEFGFLYSIYSLPNCVLPFVGGFLLDKIGIRVGTFISCALIGVGAVVVALAPALENIFFFSPYMLMVFGRFLFGMGAETAYVAQNTIIVHWFHDKEMALAMALSVSAGRFGSFLTFNINVMAVKAFHTWHAALWLGALLSLGAVVSAAVYCILDRYAEKVLKSEATIEAATLEPAALEFSHVAKFPKVFWIVCLIVTAYYSVVFPFQSTAVGLFTKKYNYSSDWASQIISFLPLTSLVLSPLFGIAVDKFGQRVILVVMGLILVMVAFLTLALTTITPIVSVVCIGIAYALVPAALWPCIPIVIDGEYTGTAFGLMSSILNAGMMIAYWAQGWLLDLLHGNIEDLLLLYVGFTALGLIAAIFWIFIDIKEGGRCAKVYKIDEKSNNTNGTHNDE